MADQSAISGTAITYSAGYTYITFTTTITGLSTCNCMTAWLCGLPFGVGPLWVYVGEVVALEVRARALCFPPSLPLRPAAGTNPDLIWAYCAADYTTALAFHGDNHQ